MSSFNPQSPKLGVDSAVGRAHWYPYYAGYSPGFVADMAGYLQVDKQADAIVLDPWNGSGTTTAVCSQRGILSAGFDLNPAMVVVARARMLDRAISSSLVPLLDALINRAKNVTCSSAREPLRAWFNEGAAGRLRAFDLAIRELLVAKDSSFDASQLSPLASFFYVMLFRLVRKAVKAGSVSNPTWTKQIFEDHARVRLTWRQIEETLRADLASIQLVERAEASRQAVGHLAVADSRSLPLADESVDVVITSPPYCTRIDYAVATRVELAALGLGENTVDALRREMLGTTVAVAASEEAALPPLVSSLIDRISAHPSKASGTYYRRTTEDYFHKLRDSLAEVSRVAKHDASLVLVVQDSYYKDVHIDLARCTEAILAELGFTLRQRWDYQSARSMRHIKAAAKANALPVETALLLKREIV